MASLSLISVNIEQSRHLDVVFPFLSSRMPDVLCVQELYESDIPRLSEGLGGAPCHYAPMMLRDEGEGRTAVMGIGIFSRLPVLSKATDFYHHAIIEGEPYDHTSLESRNKTNSGILLSCVLEKDGVDFTIATTHFTWSARGEATDYQRRDMQALLAILATKGEFALCGDFNAPRMHEGSPGEIFSMLSSRYKDNIPPSYLTSIDASLHRSGKDRPDELADKMVDGLFTTPAYTASGVELHTGVSDHCAITAAISRA